MKLVDLVEKGNICAAKYIENGHRARDTKMYTLKTNTCVVCVCACVCVYYYMYVFIYPPSRSLARMKGNN